MSGAPKPLNMGAKRVYLGDVEEFIQRGRDMSTVSNHGVATITEHEKAQVQRANATGLKPVVFVHGLWLLPSSWDRWAKMFEAAGFTALTPGWPDDPDSVAEANDHPNVFAHKSVGQVADQIGRAHV